MFDIITSRDFLAKLEADYTDFKAQPDSARHALNRIITAYHLHEWIWGDWLKTDYATWKKLSRGKLWNQEEISVSRMQPTTPQRAIVAPNVTSPLLDTATVSTRFARHGAGSATLAEIRFSISLTRQQPISAAVPVPPAAPVARRKRRRQSPEDKRARSGRAPPCLVPNP